MVLLLLIGEAREVCKFLILLAASCRMARGCRRRWVRQAEAAVGVEAEVVEVDVVMEEEVVVGVGVEVSGVTRERASLPQQFGKGGCAGEELRVDLLVGVGLVFCVRTVGVNCLVGGVILLHEDAGRERIEARGDEEAVLAIAIEAGCAAAAVAGERRAHGLALAGPVDPRNGAGNESWWDRISLAGRGNL